jgi:hypothetical protein
LAKRHFGNDAAFAPYPLVELSILRRIDDVDTSCDHRTSAARERAFMCRRVDAAGQSGRDDEARFRQIPCQSHGQLAAQRRCIACPDNCNRVTLEQRGMTKNCDDRRRWVGGGEARRKFGLAGCDHPTAQFRQRVDLARDLACRRNSYFIAAAAFDEAWKLFERSFRIAKTRYQLSKCDRADVLCAR